MHHFSKEWSHRIAVLGFVSATTVRSSSSTVETEHQLNTPPSHTRKLKAFFSQRLDKLHSAFFSNSTASSIIKKRAFPQEGARTDYPPQLGPLLGSWASKYYYYDYYYTYIFHRTPVACEEPPVPSYKRKFPVYSALDIRERVQGEVDVVWVTHGKGVYDVTEFVRHHPGMNVLLDANGGPLEPMWSLYRVHFNHEVQKKLETYRIGTLQAQDRVSYNAIDDPYAEEPIRDPKLLVLQHRPFDAETPLEKLNKNMYTPNDIFYVRNHFPVPSLDRDEHTVEISLPTECMKPASSAELASNANSTSNTFTMDDLDSFPQHQVDCFLCCAGNRSREITKSKLDSRGGQMANAKWEGVRLLNVLRGMGLDEEKLRENPEGWNVHLVGSDSYHMSVPLYLVLEEDRNILLATKMNGEELSRDHGYPIRTIVPGVAGARSVKWLNRITLSQEESDSPWHQRIYRYRPNKYHEENCDDMDAEYDPCLGWPLNSIILSPRNGDQVVVDQGGVVFYGVALPSTTGRKITKIEVSFDNETWIPCNFKPLEDKEDDGSSSSSSNTRQWSWSPWWIQISEEALREAAKKRREGRGDARKKVKYNGGGDADDDGSKKTSRNPNRQCDEVKMYCRATDESGQTQQKADPIDHRGLMYNSYHVVRAHVRRESGERDN